MDYLVIVNPTAGKGATTRAIPEIKRYFELKNLEAEIRITDYPGEATLLAKEVPTSTCRGVIAVGGDGTVLETANGLLHTNIPLGILPLGSGNDFARCLGIPLGIKHLFASLDIITAQKPKPVDVGMFSDCCFLNVASVGFDAEIIRDLPKVKRFVKGSTAYILSVFIKFLTYKTKTVQIEMDGQKHTMNIFLAAICNGTSYGGGLKVNPLGSVTDGLFDLIIIKPLPRYKIPILLGLFKKGLHLDLPYVKTYKCRTVKINSKEKLILNVDGEVAGETPVEFSLQPLSLQILQP